MSLVNPLVNRASSFEKQGMFTNKEEEFYNTNKEKVTNNSCHHGCALLTMFGGFTSFLELNKTTAEVTKAILAH